MNVFLNLFAILYRMYERWGEPDSYYRASLTIGLICAFSIQFLMAVVSRYSNWDMLMYGSVTLAISNMFFIAIVAWVCHIKKDMIINVIELKSFSSWKLDLALILGIGVIFALLIGAVLAYSG